MTTVFDNGVRLSPSREPDGASEPDEKWRLWCRLCAKEDSQGNINIFAEDDQETAAGISAEDACASETPSQSIDGEHTSAAVVTAVIEKYFCVQISRDDQLPKLLCRECYSLVDALVGFAEHVVKVQQMFSTLQKYCQLELPPIRFKYILPDRKISHALRLLALTEGHRSKVSDLEENMYKDEHEHEGEEQNSWQQDNPSHVDNVCNIVDVVTEQDEAEEIDVGQHDNSFHVDNVCNIIDVTTQQDEREDQDMEHQNNSSYADNVKEEDSAQQYNSAYADNVYVYDVFTDEDEDEEEDAVQQYNPAHDVLVSNQAEEEEQYSEQQDYMCHADDVDHIVDVVTEEDDIEKYSVQQDNPFYAAGVYNNFTEGNLKQSMSPASGTSSKDGEEMTERQLQGTGSAWTKPQETPNNEDAVGERNLNCEAEMTCEQPDNEISSCMDAVIDVNTDTHNTRSIKEPADYHGTINADYRGTIYTCSDCPRIFKRNLFYRRHMKKEHSKVVDMPQLNCTQCTRVFRTQFQLETHARVHLPIELQKVLPCPYCGKMFSTKALLKIHVQGVHMRERPFICETCGMALRSKSALKEHQRTHSDDAPYNCEICHKRFKNQYRLKYHRETHDPTKFVCPECGLELNSRATFNHHLLVHSDEMQYKCDYCGRAFKRAKTLKNHLLLHSGLHPYECDFCERTFATGANCRTHKKKTHPRELAALEARGGGKTHTPNIPKLSVLIAVSKSVDKPVCKRSSRFGQKSKANRKAAEEWESTDSEDSSTSTTSEED